VLPAICYRLIMMYRSLVGLLIFTGPVFADPPEIVGSDISANRVSVTVSHPDTGWEHYADGWRIEADNGAVIATRELLHPHVNEQPFTRSLSVGGLPEAPLFIRAKCSVDGWSETRAPLPR